MASFSSSYSHRNKPRSPASVTEGSVSPCTSPPTTSGRLSTVTSPRLQLSPSPSSSADFAGSPRGCKPSPRRDTASTATGSRAAGVTQRHSTGLRRVLSDTDTSNLPVWGGANMAQSQLMQRRRRQMLKTQQKSRAWQQGLQRNAVSAAKRWVYFIYKAKKIYDGISICISRF